MIFFPCRAFRRQSRMKNEESNELVEKGKKWEMFIGFRFNDLDLEKTNIFCSIPLVLGDM